MSENMTNDYDSILTAVDSSVINRSVYYATGKELPDHTFAMEGLPYSVSMDSAVVWCFMLIFLVLSASLYHRRRMLLFRARTFFTSRRVYSDSNVNENQNEWLNVLIISIAGSLSVGILIYYCLSRQYEFPDYYDKPHWILLVGSLAAFAYVYLRAVVYAMVNWVFFDNDERHRWNVGYFLLTVAFGYAVGILSAVSVFLHLEIKTVTLCAVFVCILYEILHIYKLFVNFRFKRYGALLIFLYFCSVEILPIMLIGHILAWIFNSYFVYNLLT